MPRAFFLGALLAGLALGGSAQAEDKVYSLNAQVADHTFQRAGYPNHVSPYARPTNTPEYSGYYVGGGCVWRGGPPGPEQGAWGWDYFGGHWLRHRVLLGWCNGCRYQGGTGQYKTDGPEVPNVFGLKLPKRETGCEGH
jgi:hypothetical protein